MAEKFGSALNSLPGSSTLFSVVCHCETNQAMNATMITTIMIRVGEVGSSDFVDVVALDFH